MLELKGSVYTMQHIKLRLLFANNFLGSDFFNLLLR